MIVNLLELHRMVGQRVMLVLLELVAGREIMGAPGELDGLLPSHRDGSVQPRQVATYLGGRRVDSRKWTSGQPRHHRRQCLGHPDARHAYAKRAFARTRSGRS